MNRQTVVTALLQGEVGVHVAVSKLIVFLGLLDVNGSSRGSHGVLGAKGAVYHGDLGCGCGCGCGSRAQHRNT